jgi:hypothetical protein
MGARRIAVIALSGALAAGGAGAAIAAVGKDDGDNAEQELLADAAQRLNVTPQRLRDALAAAQNEQIDKAVEAGDLTREQADEIKAARKKSGHVLGPPGGPWLHGGGPHPRLRGGPGKLLVPGGAGSGLRHNLLEEIAEALGTTRAKLVDDLRSGKSVADIAKAGGKSMADVRRAVKNAVKTRLDKAVGDGDLTRNHADALLERVDRRLAAIESGRAPRLHRHPGGRLVLPG